MLEYICPHCEKELECSLGDNVYCTECDKTYETDYEYTTCDVIGCQLTGVEYDGKEE